MKIKFVFFVLLVFIGYKSNAQTQLWGTAHCGGTNDLGAIYFSDGSGSTTQIAYNFVTGIAKAPIGKLCLADNGSFYGVTGLNGFHHSSYFFRYDPLTGTYTNIHDMFTDTYHGWHAKSGMIKGVDGLLYGLCAEGGVFDAGVIYSIDPSTDTYFVVHDFDGTGGSFPYGSLLQSSNGKIYGTTQNGGNNNSGVLFSYDPANGNFMKLIDFSGSTGANPYYGTLVEAGNGKLYGLTKNGGANDLGVIFCFDPAANTYIDLYDFDGINGSNPYSGLIQATDGNLYGTTNTGGANNSGTIFRFDPNINIYTDIVDFNVLNGSFPQRGLLQATNGKLYGTTNNGGTDSLGVFFSYDIFLNAYSKIADFNSTTIGSYPDGELIEIPSIETAGIAVVKNISSFIVFPNPASDIIYIKGINNELITCVDVLGREISSLKTTFTGNTILYVGSYPNVFFIKNQAGKTIKVIRNKLK